MKKVYLYDTTLRDGAQGEAVAFSLEDKLRIAQRLDTFGIDYIEGGQPGSNPKAQAFFKSIKEIPLHHAAVVAFGTTHHPKKRPEEDENLQKLLEASTEVVTIVGKSWSLHVQKVLRIKEEENLRIIQNSISYLREKGKRVFFDAEHFFDGFKEAPSHALMVLEVAQKAGAECIVLCDTNGGSLPDDIKKAVKAVKNRNISIPLGIHAHNDSDLATANTLTAVLEGITHVQGTINGYGERCGNADLCSIIPNLVLKLNMPVITEEKLRELYKLSHFISELANMPPRDYQPFVGRSAFAHKGGLHIDAVSKDPRTFEHILPEKVGNQTRLLISELAGKAGILHEARKKGLALEEGVKQEILKRLKEMEGNGYQFEGADGSFELLMKKALGFHKSFFNLEGFRVIVEKREDNSLLSEATIKVKVGTEREHTAAEGTGPVNALDRALRKALERFYPELRQMHLSDFKVRVIDAQAGTAAKVRVLIESTDEESTWATVGLSENIIEAAWEALVDSIEYKLLKGQRIS